MTDDQTSTSKDNIQTSTTLFEFLKGPYREYRVGGVRDLKAVLQRLSHNFSEFFDLSLSTLSPSHFESWRSRQLSVGKSKSTINRDLAELRSALGSAVLWGYLEENPISRIKFYRLDRTPVVRYLSASEEIDLLGGLEVYGSRNPGSCIPALVLLGLNTGMRRGELFSLVWDDIDFDSRTLVVRGGNSKSGQTRYIPLNERAHRVLVDHPDVGHGDDLVFVGSGGGRLVQVRRPFDTILRYSGIEAFRFHDLRHTFASKLVINGVSLNTVRELLGHASIETTLRYAHLSSRVKREAVGVL